MPLPSANIIKLPNISASVPQLKRDCRTAKHMVMQFLIFQKNTDNSEGN
jgi:monomeric isocitrate dehydrogenase